MRHALRCAIVLAVLAGGCAPATQRAGSGPATNDAWIERTLASLTLRQKVAQLVMPWVSGEYLAVDSEGFDRLLEWVEREGVGGLVVSVGMPHSYAAKLNALQARAAVPLLIASDMENGPGMRMGGIYSFPHLLAQNGGTEFPPVMALGATGSDTLAFELGRVLAREARAVGVHINFGPVLDVNSNPDNPIINTRSFGEDPEMVGRLAGAYIRGARTGGLMTTAKHFPGHGDTHEDSHIALPTITADRSRLSTTELPPFRAAIAAGVDGVMSAHIAVVGVEGSAAPPATLSPYFMTKVLREEIGFTGVVFTDAMGMRGVTQRYGPADALVLAVEAGADVLLMPVDVHDGIEAVAAAVQSGRIAETRIDASVRRILHMKRRAGLADNRSVDIAAVDRNVGVRAHTQLARTIAERSLTLARDAQNIVPLSPTTRRVLSITYAAVNDPVAGRAFDGELNELGYNVRRARVDERTTAAEFAELAANTADIVVVSAYVAPLEGAGTVGAGSGVAGFVESLATSGKPVVVISFGNPYLLTSFPSAPAYLLAWGGAPVSQTAAARALAGRNPITGRLPISLPPLHQRGEGIVRNPTPRAGS